MLIGDLDIREFGFPSSQDNNRRYSRYGEYQCEVRRVIRGRVRGQKGGSWSGVGFMSVEFRER